MPEDTEPSSGAEFVQAELAGARFAQTDLRGARFHKVQLTDARFRMADLTGVVMRDISLSGASIDGQIDGLQVNGVEVAPLIEAELIRREPARALLSAAEPAGPDDFRAAWDALERSWAASYERVAALPAGTVDVSVEDEWSFAQTLRHLVFATDAWLGAILGIELPFHRWGLPFSEFPEFVGPPAEFGIEEDARPSYVEVLDLRADRFGRVREFLATVTAHQLSQDCVGPVWEAGQQLSVRRCLRVILNEECEHHRFAERDLDLIEAASRA